MKEIAIVIGVIVFIVAAIAAVYIVGFKRIAISAVGKPTPEEARVQIKKEEAKAAVETKAAVEEVRNATLDENIDLGRELSERGRAERLRK